MVGMKNEDGGMEDKENIKKTVLNQKDLAPRGRKSRQKGQLARRSKKGEKRDNWERKQIGSNSNGSHRL